MVLDSLESYLLDVPQLYGMVKTKVKNCAGCNVTLKMSSGGIQTMLLHTPLKADEEYTIHSDTNATYREYWCAAQEGGTNVILTSDDCTQFSEVTLQKAATSTDPNGLINLTWKGTKRRESNNCSIL